MSDRVAVVGGGVAGLATAFHLQRAGADPVVFERDGTHGGIVAPPVEVGDVLLEPGPDSLAARKPWGADLCRRLGLTMVPPGASGAFLWTDTGLVPYLTGTAFGIPGDVGDVLRWPGLSRRGRVRALADLVKRKRRDGAEETLGELLRRRLGDEATDRAIAPLLAGLHAGDVDRLSAAATFPELLAWERTQGSLIRGAQAAQRSARRGDPGPLFLRPSGGMRELVDALADALGDRVRTGAEVTHVGDHEVRAGRRRRSGRRGRPRVRRARGGRAPRRRGSRRSLVDRARSRPGSCSSSTRPGPPTRSRTAPGSSSLAAGPR